MDLRIRAVIFLQKNEEHIKYCATVNCVINMINLKLQRINFNNMLGTLY